MNILRFVSSSALQIVCAAIFCLATASHAQSPVNGKLEKLAVRVGDRDRSYLRYVPSKLPPGRPLVIVLHGSMMSGEGMRSGETDYGFDKLADEHGFAVVYPNALMWAWNDCRKNNLVPARTETVDDVGFLRKVIRSAVQDYGSDRSKVFLFGFSGGGHLAYRMAWEAPEEIAAVATVGANLPPADAITGASSGKTPPILLIKGKADISDRYDGGPHPMSGSVISAHASAAAFARQNGLGEPDPQVDYAPKVQMLAWRTSGRPVVALYSIDGLGHMVPVQWRDKVDGTMLAWKFFNVPSGGTE